ncbi:uncharacterized protein N7487_002923 [Penicillium crustosum]|uniref:uncharacterized protein n=1 Tax=Penicillium crustosum TaxID=36656 RepID=UPI00238E92F3|nr:uncharacterized protein N7487_002923 [Penicillium crustosum]KAJ5419373.1 hypothetical protein N7487_002923 [Penicillium crustosum]
MGFVSVFSTIKIVPTELGEGICPFFITPLSERFGRLQVFYIRNLPGLYCLIASALYLNIPVPITFRVLTGCFLSILSLGPVIIRNLFQIEPTGRSISVVYLTEPRLAIVDLVSGYRTQVLRLTFTSYTLGDIYSRHSKAEGEARYKTNVDPSPVSSPYFNNELYSVTYALVLLILTTLIETIESTYLIVFSSGSIGLTFLSLAIGNTIALIFYSLTSDRYTIHQRETKGDAFKPEFRLMHLLLTSVILPLGFLIYGWTLEFHPLSQPLSSPLWHY